MSGPKTGRPVTPQGYGIKPASEGVLLPWGWARERLTSAHNYWLVSAHDGVPHAAPVCVLWLEEAFYFSTDPRSRKALNVLASGRGVVHLESGDEALMVEGHVEEVEEETAPQHFADAYEPKYRMRPDISAIGRKSGGSATSRAVPRVGRSRS